MRFFFLLIVPAAALLGGCAEHHHAARHEPRYFVPTTAIVQNDRHEVPQLAGNLLPASDGEYEFPRYDRFAYGPDYAGAYSYIYTYDYEQIGIRHSGGYGYRFRSIVQPLP